MWRKIRLTKRGVALLCGASGALVIGLLLGSADFMGLAATFMGLIVINAITLMLGSRIQTFPVSREVPRQVTCGSKAEVKAWVTGARAGAFGFTNDFTDTGDPELKISGTTVESQGDYVSVNYIIEPQRTGIWQLGPLQHRTTDMFGLVSLTGRCGNPTQLVVWPKVVDLPINWSAKASVNNCAWVLSAEPDAGTLREYVPGDDLRRIHWLTLARTNKPMVRAGSANNLPQINLLIDPSLLTDAALGEWVLEHVSSVGCALITAGGAVRLLGAPTNELIEAKALGRQRLLTAISELVTAAANANSAGSQNLTKQLKTANRNATTYAVLSANHGLPLHTMTGTCAALVLGSGRPAAAEAARLRGVGWRATALSRTAPHLEVWHSVMGAAFQVATPAPRPVTSIAAKAKSETTNLAARLGFAETRTVNEKVRT